MFSSIHKYNSEGTPVSHFTTSRTDFGRMMTFDIVSYFRNTYKVTLVRDEEMTELTSTDGVLAYVYNIDAVDCSELGYVFFDKQGGKVRRIGVNSMLKRLKSLERGQIIRCFLMTL